MNQKRLALILTAFLVAGAAGLVFWQNVSSSQVNPSQPIKAPTLSAQLQADGHIVPVRSATLSVDAAGRVTRIAVQEGQPVTTGTVLLTLEASVQAAALAQAQGNLMQAQAKLARLQAGPTAEEIAQAQSAVAVAHANLDDVPKAGPMPEPLNQARAAVAQAQAAVEQAQSAFDKIGGLSNPNIAMTSQSLQLEQASLEYQQAVASYQNLINGATPTQVKVAEQQLAQAQAALAVVAAGAHHDDIVAAEAAVLTAQATVAQAQASLDQMSARAPFAGTVCEINVRAGEFVAPGAAAIRLGDTSQWVVETDNLSDLDVVKLKPGDRVQVTVDALPDQSLAGTVSHIQPSSKIVRGNTTYKLTVTLDATMSTLYWGMNASIRSEF